MNNIEKKIYDLIIEYASCHPHRDYTIGISPYDKIPMKIRREENLSHWKELAKRITDIV